MEEIEWEAESTSSGDSGKERRSRVPVVDEVLSARLRREIEDLEREGDRVPL